MFGKLTGQRLSAQSTGQVSLDDILANSVRNTSDVGVLASFNQTEDKLAVMVFNYHDDNLPKPNAQVTLYIEGLAHHAGAGPRWKDCDSVKLTHYRIGPTHSNSYTAWLAMGSPQNPTPQQYAKLKAAGMLQTLEKPRALSVEGGRAKVEFSLPIHAISLLVLER